MSNSNSAPSSLIMDNGAFSDIDEFAAANADWDLDFRQLERGNSDITIALLASPNIIIQHYFFPHAIHQCGVAPEGFTTIGLPFGQCHLNWASRDNVSAILVDFNNPNGFDAASGSGFHAISLSISDELLDYDAELMGLQSSPILGGGQSILRSNKNQKLDQLRRFLQFLCSRTYVNSNPEDARWVLSQLEDEVPVQLLAALSELQQAPNDIPLRTRQKGLRKAIDFINENAFENPNIPEICAASCLSWRSLDRAFKECFGIGPKRYVLQLRLTRVRQMLKVAPTSARISDIANAWGFWHMGDFAQKYRASFGLYPTEQLKISS